MATPKTNISRLRVTRKLAVTNRGALKLAQRFGEALVCVRQRMDDRDRCRYTTVELLVDKTVVRRRADRIVGVRIELNESVLRIAACAAGAIWDAHAGLWRLPRQAAAALELTDRIATE